MRQYSGVALVTGASSGIGAAFARRLAAEGYELVLVARREDRLQAVARELPTPARVISADLSTTEGCASVATRVEDLDIGILVHSAGYGSFGSFHHLDHARQLAMVDVNCRAAIDLSHRFLPGMLERGDGAIIMLSSISAFQASPWLATYGATKAFGLSFAEALWVEVHDRGVDVLGLCPGPTRTEFKQVAGVDVEPSERMWSRADDVVDTALKALGRRPGVVHGAQNWFGAFLTRFVPRRFASWTAGTIMYRMSAKLKAPPPS